MTDTPHPHIEPATESDLHVIKACIVAFRLDGENISADQFVVIKRDGCIVAFGRIKPYGDGVYELGSVAVIESARGQGLGKQIVEELIRRFTVPDIYITTDLPAYFEPFGFAQITDGPAAIFDKLTRICGKLRRGVVAMHLHKRLLNTTFRDSR